MMKISRDIEYEGTHMDIQQLTQDLKEYHNENPFATGLDWARQEFWAVMENEQALVFILKHPEYKDLFKEI